MTSVVVASLFWVAVIDLGGRREVGDENLALELTSLGHLFGADVEGELLAATDTLTTDSDRVDRPVDGRPRTAEVVAHAGANDVAPLFCCVDLRLDAKGLRGVGIVLPERLDGTLCCVVALPLPTGVGVGQAPHVEAALARTW